jgi:hypothetical protein
VHDFRHAFAVNALVRWYRAGSDVQAKLPFLAAYMGHVSIVSTQYYLSFLPILAECRVGGRRGTHRKVGADRARRAFAHSLTEVFHRSVSSTPLIEPDVQISRVRLSDRFHATAYDRKRL